MKYARYATLPVFATELALGSESPHTQSRVHGILILGADAGFVGTFATGPGHERAGGAVDDGRQTHRAMALTSIGLATGSYLIMLFGNR